MHDRTDDGVLLARGRGRRATDVAGRPLYDQLDPRRQRKATARLLCQVCGRRPPPHPRGPLWLLPDDAGRLPEGELTVTPPVCPSCAALAVEQCPALLRGHIAVRVRYPRAWGYAGVLHHPDTTRRHGLRPADDPVRLPYEDPRLRWLLADHTVTRLIGCVREPIR
ncbi:hypothetical protein AB0G74_02260 [Streptomyces sp. NPDC020875]|uniref:hypothetical protein n=1 Tax=Streptomyces sp. NPDC020875 TaxID=3154898 RepID=UPI0033F5246D